MQALELPNLHDAPFPLGIGPPEAVAHRAWRATLAAILAALAGGPARIALLGPAGAGKTLLIHALAAALHDQGRSVRVAGPAGVPEDLPAEAILLVDDADRLDRDAIARVAGRPCVLAGAMALEDRLPAAFLVLVLSPMPPDEVARFVAARLATAGQRRDLLDPDAVLALARLSGGVPRQVNALAGAAVFMAGLDGMDRVSRHHVEEAAAMRDGGDAPPPPEAPEPAGAGAFEPEPAGAGAFEPEPAGAGAFKPEPPGHAPPQPLAPRRYPRTRPVAAAAGTALLLVVGAILAGRPGTAPKHPATVAVPAAPVLPSTAPQQEAALPSLPSNPPPTPLPAPPASEPAAAPDPAATAPALGARAPSAAPEPAAASGQRVVLHYGEGAAAEANRLAALLAEQTPRFGRVETRAVLVTPRGATIRFFHPEDVGAAWDLEAALRSTGDDWQVRNFTSYRPRPRRGTLEVWIR